MIASPLRRAATAARLLRSTDRALRTDGLAGARRHLDQHTVAPLTVTDPAAHAVAQAHLVRRLARILPWELTCLRKALVIQRILRADGITTRTIIGIRRVGPGDYLMHAWNELDGVALLDDEARLDDFRRSLLL